MTEVKAGPASQNLPEGVFTQVGPTQAGRTESVPTGPNLQLTLLLHGLGLLVQWSALVVAPQHEGCRLDSPTQGSVLSGACISSVNLRRNLGIFAEMWTAVAQQLTGDVPIVVNPAQKALKYLE